MKAKDFLLEWGHHTDTGWEDLNLLKELAYKNGKHLAGSYQLFVPRKSVHATTRRDARLKNLSNPYAYDDEGNLRPEYERIENQYPVTEGAPILNPGKSMSPPGWNKPSGASIWTSTCKKLPNGKWESEWSEWLVNKMVQWMSPVGYLYKVKPGALIIELDEHMARDIKYVFKKLDGNYDEKHILLDFPWDRVSQHFDAVHITHRGYDFTEGWDVESTAWLDSSFLQLIGEVPVETYGVKL